MYQVLDALKEVLDRDLDAAERSHIEERLAMARRSTDPRIAQLAVAVAGLCVWIVAGGKEDESAGRTQP